MHSTKVAENPLSFLQPLQITKVEILTQGLTNRCLKIYDLSGQKYVWRPENEIAKLFGLSRKDEYHVIKIAAQFSLCPSPIKLCQQGLLLPWIEGDTLEAMDEKLAANLLQKIHQLPLFNQSFDPFIKAQEYYHALDDKLKSAQLMSLHEKIINKSFTRIFAPKSCHFDLGFYNLIKTAQDEIKIIDWEYATTADPALDLVMTAMANNLDIALLVEEYCSICKLSQVNLFKSTCSKYLPICQYLNLLWYFLAYQYYQDESYLDQASMLLKMMLC